MLRVLHCVSKMDRGGIETLIMNVYRNVDRSKIQFDFLVFKPEDGEYDNEIIQLGGKIFKVRSRREGVFKNISDLNSFFEKTTYSIVHIHVSSMTNVEAIKSAFKKKVPNRIIHCHNTKGPKGLLHEFMHRYNRLMIDRYCTDKFACSKDAAIWGFGDKKVKNGDVHIFKNAVNTSEFIYNSEVRLKMREELNLNDKFVIGHVGRFAEQKNHKFIVSIFSELLKIKPNSTLILVGVGNLQKTIKKQVKDLGIENSVLFLGSRSDVNCLMQAMDIFLFPSLFEGLGIVAVEAQASGLPVFASDVVPKEAAITELFHSISLSSSPKIWAKKIVEASNNMTRRDRSKDIMDSGYDIRANTEWITNYYFESQSPKYGGVCK